MSDIDFSPAWVVVAALMASALGCLLLASGLLYLTYRQANRAGEYMAAAKLHADDAEASWRAGEGQQAAVAGHVRQFTALVRGCGDSFTRASSYVKLSPADPLGQVIDDSRR